MRVCLDYGSCAVPDNLFIIAEDQAKKQVFSALLKDYKQVLMSYFKVFYESCLRSQKRP